MTNKRETPAGSRLAGVSWKTLDRTSTKILTPTAHRAQNIIDVRGLLADLAAMLATLVLGGSCHEL
jgi:hypothetical protein